MPEPRRKTPVDPPAPAEKQSPGAGDGEPNTLALQRRAQEKEFRQTIDELFTRVRDLKAELDHTPTTNVFSVDIFKRTQEIEKLAKRLKSYARA